MEYFGLKSLVDGFRDLLKQKMFFDRVCMFGVDEIHLIYWWGKSFRPAFQLLVQMRAKLARDQSNLITLVGLTAILREGPPIIQP